MSGHIRGKVDILLDAGLGSRNAQEFFKCLYDFLAGHPQADLVARNCGLDSSPGDTGYWDEPNPFASNAWAVFRMRPTLERPYPVYYLIQWSGTVWGATPGDPGLLEGSASGIPSVGIQAAIGVGGDQNPWAGTETAGIENDQKSDPVWRVPEGGTEVHVFPRANNDGGSFAGSRQSFTSLGSFSSAAVRYNILADDDTLLILTSPYGSEEWRSYFAGIYDVHPSNGIYRPFCSFGSVNNTIPYMAGSTYGLLDGLGAQGGLIHAFGGVRGMAVDRLQALLTTSVQPENLVNSDEDYEEYLEHGLAICSREANVLGVSASGFAGRMGSFIREVSNVDSGDTDESYLRAAFGGSTKESIKITVPWSGVAPPGSSGSRGGFDFVRDRVPSDDAVSQ